MPTADANSLRLGMLIQRRAPRLAPPRVVFLRRVFSAMRDLLQRFAGCDISSPDRHLPQT